MQGGGYDPNMQQGMLQQGMMQPGMMQQGMMQPGMMQPGMMQPGMMQPGMEQGMMQPGMMQPGMMQPGMMQPGMMQPGQQQMGGGPLMQVDPYKMLSGIDKVLVKEKVNVLEAAAGLVGDLMGVGFELEMANKYSVTTENGHPLFFASEQTDALNRNVENCGCGECRAIDLDIVVLGQDSAVLAAANGEYDFSMNPFTSGIDLSNSQKFMKVKKEFACTFCCFNRPAVEIFDGNGNQIGKIRDPWHCYNYTFALEDAAENGTLTATACCCQAGLWCPCPCGPCREVSIDVNDAHTDASVGSLTKQVPDCMKFIVSDDTDNYVVDFGQVQDPQWKSMMIALALFIDFRYFNQKSDKFSTADF